VEIEEASKNADIHDSIVNFPDGKLSCWVWSLVINIVQTTSTILCASILLYILRGPVLYADYFANLAPQTDT
jgi:hypothetical protein